nr:MAG TPA: hypothetical protein [Caudoviricetes sp.]
MLVTTTVDVKHLIDRGALVVNPTFIPKTKEELINHLNGRADASEWKHIFIPYNIADNMFNLTDFTSFTSFELTEDLGCANLDTLRLHFLSEVTDSMFIIDLYYTSHLDGDLTVYDLNKVIVYDERKDTGLIHTFKINKCIQQHIYNLKFNPEINDMRIETIFTSEENNRRIG